MVVTEYTIVMVMEEPVEEGGMVVRVPIQMDLVMKIEVVTEAPVIY